MKARRDEAGVAPGQARSTAHGFRRLPIRVAAVTTAVVAVVYLVVAVAVVLIVGQNQLNGIDARLAEEINAVRNRPDLLGFLAGQGQFNDLDPDRDARRFQAPLLVWVTAPDGSSYQSDPTAVLPASTRQLTGPATVTISGSEMRVVGTPLPGATGTGWITIAQTTADIASARSNLIVAEGLIAPALLLLIFVGSLAIGRRVAGPIERARQRQLEFTADASHELRTPLTVIEAETSLALGSPRESTADRQTLERIQEETRHLRRLVEDLLWLARFDAAPAQPDAAPIDLGALATTTAERFRPVCEQRQIALTTRVTGSMSPVVSAPAEWLARLLSVLLDNAVRYSPAGGAVRVTVASDLGRVRLTVDDTGPGIPPADRESIFDRFRRASDQPGGAGLGLAIGNAIVRATSGTWEIGDAPEGGARMSVSWPRSSGSAYEQPSVEQAGDATRPAIP